MRPRGAYPHPDDDPKEKRCRIQLPALPYDYDALEPTIDAKTMEIHHGKHHQAYVDNLNKALEGTAWADRDVEDVIQNLDAIPEDKRAAVRNNGGGHANHSLFWTIMQPKGGGDPSGELEAAINDDVRRRGRAQGGDERRRREALRLGLDVARGRRRQPRRRCRRRTRTAR